MTDLARYEFSDGISAITLDDGKVNCFSPAMVASFNRALDQADKDGGVVLVSGRPGILSAGFDLREFEKGEAVGQALVRDGALLAERLFAHPRPVVIACTGHAIAMGCFILLAATVRIGVDGEFKIGANEVAIGMAVPRFATELCRHRLATAYQTRAITTAELFSPAVAVDVGFLDRVVTAEALADEARKTAVGLAELSDADYTETLTRLRKPTRELIRDRIATDYT
ncbi:MAG: crotonase/enoyl-CoA hydratase family protein [Pseudomonadota bacterium]